MAGHNWSVRRYLRFSVRGMLLALTVGCLLFGRQVESRRRMIVAADELMNNGTNPYSTIRLADLGYYGPENHRAMLLRFWDAQALPYSVVVDYVRDERVLATVSQLTSIQKLNFGSPDPCDEWLRYLAPLQELRVLYLNCPMLTDRAIAHISRLNRLEQLLICRETGMTANGILQLRRALPNCVLRVVYVDKQSYVDYPPPNGRVVDPTTIFPEMGDERCGWYREPTPIDGSVRMP
jgi:hypothetical protein